MKNVLSELKNTETETLLKMDLQFFAEPLDLEYLLERAGGKVTEEAAAYLKESAQGMTGEQYRKTADVISRIWETAGESVDQSKAARILKAIREDESTVDEIVEMVLTQYNVEPEVFAALMVNM